MPEKLLKYWPLILFLVAMLGSGMTYYTGMAAVAQEVQSIQTIMPTLARSNIVDLQFTITENKSEALQKKVDENERRAAEQYEKVEKKLDKVIDLLLQQQNN